MAADADRPVLVFGHHHVWSPDSATRAEGYFGIDPSASRAPRRAGRRPPGHPRLLRRPHPPQPGAAHQHQPGGALGRGRLRQGLPGRRGPSTGCTRAACCRCSTASRPPTPWCGASAPATCSAACTSATRSATSATAASPCRPTAGASTSRGPGPAAAGRPARRRPLDGAGGPGLRPLPGRLRGGRREGRAPRLGRHPAGDGLAGPGRRRDPLLEAGGPQQAQRRARSEGPRRARRRSAADRHRRRGGRELPAGQARGPRAGPRRADRRQPPPGGHPGDRLRSGRPLRPAPGLRHARRGHVRVRRGQRRARRRPAAAADRPHRRGDRARRRLRHPGGGPLAGSARWST